ncbi:MAG: type II toxin-antitoxin system RelE/ParE family toxin [Candidatus Rokubacteria bacterium]|nr:type II toxin-antitoxin system RelE/ParE family toxin [Candidatus Rokubacteria bacterium]MBI2555333.1 type II toxin-antitoxin system RelE/ParE family toxin [Candidatus Rokubacteria bacterium]
MSAFTVQLTRAAVKDLDGLLPSLRDQVTQDLRQLEEAPVGPPPRIKRLRGFPFPLYRLRSGDYRILYRIDEAVITVMRVINRRDLDRALRQLQLK